ncbi:phage antirepressor KilAC domain-containing protein [Lysinibacillus sp. RC79]|uniref:phage antirepressor KilAC domain-containing protein n=1 Tax=Lysinibacillus sp. RC79 TaxID=3156296 RepID=UPI003519A497
MINLVVIQKRQAVTTSLQVSETFEKQHKNVIQVIENLVAENSATKNMFYEGSYENRGKQYKMYYMNRDGFTLLAMGFNGSKALEFKLKYIDAFNKMESQLKPDLPGTYKEALQALIQKEEERERLALENQMYQQQIADAAPKLNYVDIVLKCPDLLTATQVADDYGMSARKFNSLLHDLGIQYKQSGQWFLYEKYKGQGYTKSETTHFTKTNGDKGASLLTKWTQKGRLFLYELLKEHDILPTIEIMEDDAS